MSRHVTDVMPHMRWHICGGHENVCNYWGHWTAHGCPEFLTLYLVPEYKIGCCEDEFQTFHDILHQKFRPVFPWIVGCQPFLFTSRDLLIGVSTSWHKTRQVEEQRRGVLRHPVRPNTERRTAIRQTVPTKAPVEAETSTIINKRLFC